MEVFLQLLVSGAAIGFIYALVGLEYTIVYNATNLLNFAHDKFIMLGAYFFVGTFILDLGLPIWLAIVLSLIIMFLFGVVVSMGIFNPLRNMDSRLFAIMGTIALGRIINEMARLVWGALPLSITRFMTGVFRFGNIVISKANVLIIVIAVLMVLSLHLYMKHTKMGKAMRCINQNKAASTLMGINVGQNINLTLGISAVICGVIGILLVPMYNVESSMATMIGMKGFAAGVVGGFGYIPGAILGGILVGLVETLSVMFLPAVYKDCVAFALLIVFLLIRPLGILGHRR